MSNFRSKNDSFGSQTGVRCKEPERMFSAILRTLIFVGLTCEDVRDKKGT